MAATETTGASSDNRRRLAWRMRPAFDGADDGSPGYPVHVDIFVGYEGFTCGKAGQLYMTRSEAEDFILVLEEGGMVVAENVLVERAAS